MKNLQVWYWRNTPLIIFLHKYTLVGRYEVMLVGVVLSEMFHINRNDLTMCLNNGGKRYKKKLDFWTNLNNPHSEQLKKYLYFLTNRNT